MNFIELLRFTQGLNLLLQCHVIRSNNCFDLFFAFLPICFINAVFLNMIIALNYGVFLRRTGLRFFFSFLIFWSGYFAALDFTLALYFLKLIRLLNPDFSRPSRTSLDRLSLSIVLFHRIIYVRPLFWRSFLKMRVLAVGGLHFKVAHIFMVVRKLRLRDRKRMLQFGVLFGEGRVVGEGLLELSQFAGVEARAAMIKKIRYWELSPKK